MDSSIATLPFMFRAPLIVPVLLAGGTGSRLWPLSREQFPKQFLQLLGPHSLLQQAALRALKIPQSVPPVVLGAEAHRFIIQEQMQRIGVKGWSLLLEPQVRNTAPAAAAVSHFVQQEYGPEAIVLLMPADQAIADLEAFLEAVAIAAQAANDGSIVTFGITPTSPATGFGYLKSGAQQGSTGVYNVEAFVEKPALAKAEAFLRQGGYYWNGGMFMYRSGRLLAELDRLEPAMHDLSLASVALATRDNHVVKLDAASFSSCREESIDYAVMEKVSDLALVPLDAGWDDVGSWTYLAKLPADDARGNRFKGDVLVEDGSNNLVHASSRLVALVGIDDAVVVETGDAVLVTRKDRVQDVKKLVQRLKVQTRPEVESHVQVHRPWGYYETIAEGPRFQVKRIVVKPGEKLSLQMHHHRAEHWTVVQGTATVTCGDNTFMLSENESTFIPLGSIHRLENPGKVSLELIEVQSGTYLGEDDIVRFNDVYGRSEPARAAAAANPQSPVAKTATGTAA